MNVSRLEFPAPILCIDDFMTSEAAAEVYRECVDLQRVYMPAMVGDEAGAMRKDPVSRRNEVIYLAEIFKTPPDRSRTLTEFRKALASEEAARLWAAGGLIFNVINCSNWNEAVVSRYGNCDFFSLHKDTMTGQTRRRMVTIVFYVNSEPERFEGGEIMFREGEAEVRVKPRHNRAVVFPSSTLHMVDPVRLDSQRWEDGRFSINYWVGFREPR